MKKIHLILFIILMAVTTIRVQAEEIDENSETQEFYAIDNEETNPTHEGEIETPIEKEEHPSNELEENVLTTGETEAGEIIDEDKIVEEPENSEELPPEEVIGDLYNQRQEVITEDNANAIPEPPTNKLTEKKLTKQTKIYLVAVYTVIGAIFLVIAYYCLKIYKYTLEQAPKEEEPESNEIIVN